MTEDMPRVAAEPFDRLTRMCAVMTEALNEAEAQEAPDGDEKHTPIKSIVFIEDSLSAGIVTNGYEDTSEAMAALFTHMRAIFRAQGTNLEFVAIPDSPEGAGPALL
jgi:hypothetical protein